MRRGRVLCAVLAAAAVFALFWRPPAGFSLTMLDVGQGDCLVLRSGRATFLVDGGSSSVSEVGAYRIVPYLKSQAIRRIDGIFVTHGDIDHISGIEELLEEIAAKRCAVRVGNVLMPAWMRGDEIGQRLAEKAAAAGAEVRFLAAGDEIATGETQIRVVAPSAAAGEADIGNAAPEGAADKSNSETAGRTKTGDISKEGASAVTGNEGSLVLHVAHRGLDILLTGDLEGAGEEAALPLLPDVDILKVAHHGSRNSTSEDFLAQTSPEICLVSAPDGGRYGHPHQETLDRIEAAGADSFITRDCGAVTVGIHAGGISIETYCKK